MKFHYMGKYNGDEQSLPKREHPVGAVAFKEAEDMNKLALMANIGGFSLMCLLAFPFGYFGAPYLKGKIMQVLLGVISSSLIFIVHEFIHALCYQEDVYCYTNFNQGLAFVCGTEDFSKSRFVFMCLLPNIILGWIPYLLFLIHPAYIFLGSFGLICTGMGFGDYINAFNAITQMPKGAKTYLSGMHSYWYK